MLTGAAWLNVLSYGFTGLFLFIDAIIYWFISILFGLFETLASARIFTQSMYQDFANKIYVVIGVVMLFYLTYALLKSLINPDDIGKNTSKIAINLIVSLILLGVVPIIFDYAFNIQDAIIEEHVIDRLIFDEDQANLSNKGIESAWNVMNAFINPENVEIEGEGHINLPLIYQPGGVMLSPFFKGETYKWSEFRTKVLDGSITFLNVTDFVEDIHKDDDVVYIPIVGSICGIFLAYVLISFCIDLGIRVAKLAFFQIIAPIPIILRIVPEKKSVFDNWIKKLIAVFMEVFIRMFIMYIIVYLTAGIFRGKAALPDDIGMIAMVIVVMGLFAFAKEAPKLIGEVIGIDSGNIKLGIGGKLAAGGAFGIGAMLGGGLKTGVRSIAGAHPIKNIKETKGFYNKAKIISSTAAGAVTGLTNGVIGSAKAGFTAKNLKEAMTAVTEGNKKAEEKRMKKENYKANHGGNIKGIIGGHTLDLIDDVKIKVGLELNIEELKGVQSKINEVTNARKAIDDRLDAILQKNKNKFTSRKNYQVAGVGQFLKYSDLLNEIEIMKSTGETSSGNKVTSQMLSDMDKTAYNMKESMKADILAGYDLENNPQVKFSKNDFKLNYDAQLESLVTDYRTKAYQNIKTISDNADTSIPLVKNSLNNLTNYAVDNKEQSIYDFVTSDNVVNFFDKTSNDALKSASRTADIKVAARYQEEAKKGKQ